MQFDFTELENLSVNGIGAVDIDYYEGYPTEEYFTVTALMRGQCKSTTGVGMARTKTKALKFALEDLARKIRE